jgi:hypothetical protein
MVGWRGVVRAGGLHIHILISPFSCYWAFVVAYIHKFVAGLGVLWGWGEALGALGGIRGFGRARVIFQRRCA